MYLAKAQDFAVFILKRMQIETQEYAMSSDHELNSHNIRTI